MSAKKRESRPSDLIEDSGGGCLLSLPVVPIVVSLTLAAATIAKKAR